MTYTMSYTILVLVAVIAGNVIMIGIGIARITPLLEEIADHLRETDRRDVDPVSGSRYQQKRTGGE